MSNFNTALSKEDLTTLLDGNKRTNEDVYIRDRECYMAGKRGDDKVYSAQRDVDMYFMGLQSFNAFGAANV